MGQRSDKSAHYNKGIWRKRNARYYDDQRGKRAKPVRRAPKWLGWTAQMWQDAHFVRWGQHHGPRCPCLESGIRLWQGLQATGLVDQPFEPENTLQVCFEEQD